MGEDYWKATYPVLIAHYLCSWWTFTGLQTLHPVGWVGWVEEEAGTGGYHPTDLGGRKEKEPACLTCWEADARRGRCLPAFVPTGGGVLHLQPAQEVPAGACQLCSGRGGGVGGACLLPAPIVSMFWLVLEAQTHVAPHRYPLTRPIPGAFYHLPASQAEGMQPACLACVILCHPSGGETFPPLPTWLITPLLR